MDVFKIEAANLNANLVKIEDEITEVNFDAGSEFNLNFFEESTTQSVYSDHEESFESSRDTPPTPPPLTPLAISPAPNQQCFISSSGYISRSKVSSTSNFENQIKRPSPSLIKIGGKLKFHFHS